MPITNTNRLRLKSDYVSGTPATLALTKPSVDVRKGEGNGRRGAKRKRVNETRTVKVCTQLAVSALIGWP